MSDKVTSFILATAGVIMMVYGVRVIALGVYHNNEAVGLVFGALYFGTGYLLGKLAWRNHYD